MNLWEVKVQFQEDTALDAVYEAVQAALEAGHSQEEIYGEVDNACIIFADDQEMSAE